MAVIAAAIELFVVAAGVFGGVAQIVRPGQGVQHLQRQRDVLFDDGALPRVQGAPGNAQVADLILRQQIAFPALRPDPAPGGDAPDPFLRGRVHAFPSSVAAVHMLAVVLQFGQPFPEASFQGRNGRRIAAFERGGSASQPFDLGIALEHLEAGVHQIDAIQDGLQLGPLVHDVNRRGDFTAVVQQTGDFQLVHFLGSGTKILQPAPLGSAGRFGDHHRQDGNPLAVGAGIGRLVVDGDVDQPDQGFEQGLQLLDQLLVGQGDGRLGRQRFRQLPVGRRKGSDLPGFRVEGVDELERADDSAFVVLHRHGQKRAGTVAGPPIELVRPGKIEVPVGVGVVDHHRGIVQHRIGDHHVGVGLARRVVQRNRRERDGRPGGPAHVESQRVVAQHLETELPAVFLQPVQGARIGVQQIFGRDQNRFQQLLGVALSG